MSEWHEVPNGTRAPISGNNVLICEVGAAISTQPSQKGTLGRSSGGGWHSRFGCQWNLAGHGSQKVWPAPGPTLLEGRVQVRWDSLLTRGVWELNNGRPSESQAAGYRAGSQDEQNAEHPLNPELPGSWGKEDNVLGDLGLIICANESRHITGDVH